MSNDAEIISWILEYAAFKDYPPLIEACVPHLTEAEKEKSVYLLLAALNHITQTGNFHTEEEIRFALMVQSVALVLAIEEKVSAILGSEPEPHGASELIEECNYQAILCGSTRKEVDDLCTQEESTPSQPNTANLESIMEGIRKLASAKIKGNKIPAALKKEHLLADLEGQIATYVTATKALLPTPTLVELQKKRQLPKVPRDVKPYTIDELYFAWDGHDIEWQMLQDLTHPDVKAFYRNNPNMPKELRDHVKSLPDNKAKLQQIKTPSSVSSPYFSSASPSPSPAASKSSGTPASPFSKSFHFHKPVNSTKATKTAQNSQPLTQLPSDDEKEKEKEEQEDNRADDLPVDNEAKGEEEERHQIDLTLGKELRQKSRRLFAMGEDPLDDALEYSNKIRGELNKNKSKKREIEESEESEESDDIDKEKNKKQKKDTQQTNGNKSSAKSPTAKNTAKPVTNTTKPAANKITKTYTKPPKPTKKAEESDDDLIIEPPRSKKAAATKKKVESESEDSESEKEASESEKESESEQDDNDEDVGKAKSKLTLKSPTAAPKIKIYRTRFSTTEERYLREGVKKHGAGKWKEILMSYNFHNRTAVDLKDKWRNMERSKHKR